MNTERTQAYGRVMATLADLSDAKLHPDEQDTVREAADAMLFCERLENDPAAEESLNALYELTDRLVESERLAAAKARELTTDVEDCGPLSAVR